jgi:hypothetical protein
MENLNPKTCSKRAKRHDKEWVRGSGGYGRGVEYDHKIGREWKEYREEMLPFRHPVGANDDLMYGQRSRCYQHFLRVLKAHRGCPWDAVYSKLCDTAPAGAYARTELENLIKRTILPVEWVDGALVFATGYCQSAWYVDPRDGCLRSTEHEPAEQAPARKSNYKLKKAVLKDMIQRGEIKKRRVTRAPKV